MQAPGMFFQHRHDFPVALILHVSAVLVEALPPILGSLHFLHRCPFLFQVSQHILDGVRVAVGDNEGSSRMRGTSQVQAILHHFMRTAQNHCQLGRQDFVPQVASSANHGDHLGLVRGGSHRHAASKQCQA